MAGAEPPLSTAELVAKVTLVSALDQAQLLLQLLEDHLQIGPAVEPTDILAQQETAALSTDTAVLPATIARLDARAHSVSANRGEFFGSHVVTDSRG